MHRLTVWAVLIVGCSITSMLTAGDMLYTTRTTKLTAPSKTSSSSDLEQLQRMVSNLAHNLEAAEDLILTQQDEIDSLRQTIESNETYLSQLKETVEVGSGGITISANWIDLNATSVDINSPTTTAAGLIECESLITESVVSETYTPGVGNLW